MQPIINQWTKSELAYCSNVHPGEQLDKVLSNLTQCFAAVLHRREIPTMASGLWLAESAAKQLINETSSAEQFSQALRENQVELTSLNGFPYGDFHQKVVKQAVYLPTWAEKSRLEYTKNLACILAREIQNQQHTTKGAISTLPLAYAKNWSNAQHQQAVQHLIELAVFLSELETRTQVRIQVGLEMEPDCVLENTKQLINFFNLDLLPQAQKKGLAQTQILNYIGCCFDTCHQAVMHENIKESLKDIRNSGIQICKIQLSNAITASIQSTDDIKHLCTLFNDEKFLHQCKIKQVNGELVHIDDLSEQKLTQAFNQYRQLFNADNQVNTLLPQPMQCRVHYHIPIHLTEVKADSVISTTQYAILDTLDYLQANSDFKPYLEIETYTWLQYLNTHQQKDAHSQASQHTNLITGLTEEFIWLEQALNQRQLLSNQ